MKVLVAVVVVVTHMDFIEKISIENVQVICALLEKSSCQGRTIIVMHQAIRRTSRLFNLHDPYMPWAPGSVSTC